MYRPRHFAVEDPAELRAHVEAHPFGILVTPDLEASHLPFRLEDGGARLVAHMARANRQWRQLAEADQVLVVFPGPHAFVSARWFGASPAVPSWNYTAVHVYGRARLLDDPQERRDALARLAAGHEPARPVAWTLEEEPADYADRMLRRIVAFEIEISRVEGKRKLSQNKPAPQGDRGGAELEAVGSPAAREIASLMKAHSRPPRPAAGEGTEADD